MEPEEERENREIHKNHEIMEHTNYIVVLYKSLKDNNNTNQAQ